MSPELKVALTVSKTHFNWT